jgi:hypothetical protein
LSFVGGLAWLMINLLQSIESIKPLPQNTVLTSSAVSNRSSRKKKNSSTPIHTSTTTTSSKSLADVKTIVSKMDSKSSTLEEFSVVKLGDLISAAECSLIPGAFILSQLFYFCIFHSLANLPLNDKLLYGIHQR